MAEKRVEVSTTQVVYKCDACEDGTMIHNGRTGMDGRIPTYYHVCDSRDCHHKAWFIRAYPYYEYGPLKKPKPASGGGKSKK